MLFIFILVFRFHRICKINVNWLKFFWILVISPSKPSFVLDFCQFEQNLFVIFSKFIILKKYCHICISKLIFSAECWYCQVLSCRIWKTLDGYVSRINATKLQHFEVSFDYFLLKAVCDRDFAALLNLECISKYLGNYLFFHVCLSFR